VTATDPPLVLFLCTANAARSQMAEAFLCRKAGDRFRAASAGLQPTSVHPLTHRVLNEIGLDTSAARSKHASEFLGKVAVRYAVIVCDRAHQQCPRIFPFCGGTLYWPFDDPAAPEIPEEDRLAAFRRVRDEISGRLDAWLEQLGEDA
jgi:arsenate reductase